MWIQPANELFIFPQENLHEQLALGLLAGNVFDWGAKEVALLMESGTGLRFEDALKFVNPRPWLVDNLGGFQLTFVKFIYSEKATKFCKISTLNLSSLITVKATVEFS